MTSIGSPPPPVAPPGYGGPKKSARSTSLGDEGKIRDAQNEVANKVTEIHDQLQQVEHEGDAQIDHLKENYSRESLAENTREETAIASEKLKGYERLRDLQRAQAAELSRVKREGETEIAKLNEYYRDATFKADRRGDELLRNTETGNSKRIQYEAQTGAAAADQVRHEQNAQLEQLQADRDQKISTLEKQAHDLYEKKRDQTYAAIEQSNQKLDSNFQEISHAHQEVMGRLQNETYSELQKARLDGSRKLAAYHERQEDPFYQMMDLHAEFEDQGDKYVLTAKVPQHEQKDIKIAIRGNQLVISGTRRNEEHVELTPGHERGTNSFQSFMESFPFNYPVDSKMLSHEFHGDHIVVTVPKKLMATEYKPYKAKPARAQVQKPDFPANLPHVGDELAPQGEVAATKGSSTLVKE